MNTKGTVEIPGGTFRMGSDGFYPEEAPVPEVSVPGFWIDRHPVTVAEFRRFVKDSGYVTAAEQPPAAEDYPDADAELLVPGSLVFRKTARTPISTSRAQKTLEQLVDSLRGAGVDFALADVRRPVVDVMRRSGLAATIGEDRVYHTIDEAALALAGIRA